MPNRKPAFTLAEVLIALALLGVVAAFAIPKVLQSTGDHHKKAVTQEALATVSEAYQLYLKEHNGTVPANLTFDALVPYINTLGADTTSFVDDRYMGALEHLRVASGRLTCSSFTGGINAEFPQCVRLPSGAVIVHFSYICFGGTTPKHVLPFHIDHDGKATGKNDNMRAFLHTNGKLSYDNTADKTYFSNNCTTEVTPDISFYPGLPPWFQ